MIFFSLKGVAMKFKYWVPFILFIIPTIIITYFMWEPEVWQPYPKKETIAIIGMCVMWFFVGVTYFSGIRTVIKDMKEKEG
jgi:hypothetical protein